MGGFTCLQATGGRLYCPETTSRCDTLVFGTGGRWYRGAREAKLADPASRAGWEPFDVSYYKWKYRKVVKEPVKVDKEPQRPNLMRGLLLRDELATKLAKAEARGREMDRDILELQAYISEVTEGIEAGIAAKLATQEMELGAQAEFILRLKANVILAREALLVALEARRRHQNLLAAIEAVIRYYY